MIWLLVGAYAQTSPEVSGQLFRPSIDAQKTLWTDDSGRAPKGYLLGRGVLHYANLPVVYATPAGDRVNVVSDVLQLSMLGAYTAGPVRIGLDVPLYLRSDGLEGGETGLGDIGVDVKATLLDPQVRALGLALAGRVTLPTTTVDAALGNRGLGWELEGIVDKHFDKLLLAANVGTRGIPGQDLENFRWDDQFQARGGIGYGALEKSGVSLDVGTSLTYANLTRGSTPVEAMLGGWARVPGDFKLRGGVGTGLTSSFGAPRFRVLAGIAYEPPRIADADGDGLVDAKDACRDVAEDFDRFEDEDGCPEPTQVTVELKGPKGERVQGTWTAEGARGESGGTATLPAGSTRFHAEAVGFQPVDAEIAVPEGPPFVAVLTLEPDAPPPLLTVRVIGPDGKPIPGATWTRGTSPDPLAPDQPVAFAEAGEVEVRASAEGFKPKSARITLATGASKTLEISLEPAKAEIKGDRIDIKESVYFETANATIKPESFALLEEVAQILREHPEILRLRIEGHTDSRGSEAYNLDLSTRRAASVRAFLIGRGIDAGRLESQGFGESKPLDRQENEAAWTRNRRVDFFVAQRAD